MTNDKYKMFKNFMHNELSISKDDIQEWIHESIKEEARKLIEHTYEDINIESVVRKEIKELILTSNWYDNRPELKDRIEKEVIAHLCENFSIDINKK